MSTRYETIKSTFNERVLPYFPNARVRFSKHFRSSYNILRATGPNIPLDLAFTVLGLKPLSLVEHWQAWQPSREFARALSEAGLNVKVHSKPFTDPGIEVFDPELAAEPLSKMLNRHVSPEEAEEAVNHAFYWHSHGNELLGYPQPFPWLSLFDAVHTKRSYLEIQNAGPDYRSGFGCVLSDFEPLVPMLPAYASAAAVVEDIRESPTDIISMAKIDTQRIFFMKLGKLINEISVSIQRTGAPGVWIIE